MVVTEAKDRRWQKMDRDKIDLLDLARHFELYNRTEGKSDKTVIWYNQAITSFYRFLVMHKKPTNIGELGGVPPKKESSVDVRLELKIKGVNHGQEITFSRADHQQVARS